MLQRRPNPHCSESNSFAQERPSRAVAHSTPNDLKFLFSMFSTNLFMFLVCRYGELKILDLFETLMWGVIYN
ncbi:hypothetical protein HN51_055880, partial [Arachis hypogaea]